MASTTGYTYQPLKTPSSIRLLKLLPGYVHGMISCTIEEFRDVERPDYHALSYCWGDPKPTRKILLNNHERGLHENLWQFLHQTLDAGRCSPYYWTDSLCLDQSKTEELKQQVPRMGIMYTNAALVVVWLGIDIGPGEEIWGCQYWERTWIIQEFLLAENLIITYDNRSKDLSSFVEHVERQLSWKRYSALGISEVDYKLLKLAAGLRWENASPEGAVFNKPLPYPLWKGSPWKRPTLFTEYLLANEVLELCRWRDKPKQDLVDLLEFTSNRQSTKEVDKVYGVLGLANEPMIAERIDVNYEKTIQDIYWDILFEVKSREQTVQQWQDLLLKVQLLLVRVVADGWKLYDIRNLEVYANSSKISKTYKEIALAALDILQAMLIVLEKVPSITSVALFTPSRAYES